MAFTIKHNGTEYPVTVTKKNGQFIFVLIQIHGYAECPSTFYLCRCTHSIGCRLNHYKNLKKEIFEEYNRRFSKCA